MPLEIRIQGFDIVNLEARMQAMLRPCYAAITTHARDGKPALVFVPTRRHAKAAALDLLTHAAADGAPHRFRQVCGTCRTGGCCAGRLSAACWLRLPALSLRTTADPAACPPLTRPRPPRPQAEEADIAPYLERVADPALKHALRWVRGAGARRACRGAAPPARRGGCHARGC